MFVCNMMLNQTSRSQVDRVRHEFFRRWPSPEKTADADQQEMSDLIASLGFRNKRSAAIIRMSKEFITKEWKEPRDLYGLGQYAQDSYDIFVRNKLPRNPTDHKLRAYVKWVRKQKF